MEKEHESPRKVWSEERSIKTFKEEVVSIVDFKPFPVYHLRDFKSYIL